jgi:hypothetical protein
VTAQGGAGCIGITLVAVNPDCYHNAELDVSGLPDNVTFGELQRRMLCTVCDHRGADVAPSWLHHGD